MAETTDQKAKRMSRWATTEERFWAKVDKDGPIPEHAPELGPCWIWIGSRRPDEYGNFWVGYDRVRAHRFSYALAYGKTPPELVIDHLCRVEECVNPAHLEAVTNEENLRRGIKGELTTHCPAGHAYTAENTYRKPNGWRQCRICKRAAWRRWKERHSG